MVTGIQTVPACYTFTSIFSLVNYYTAFIITTLTPFYVHYQHINIVGY